MNEWRRTHDWGLLTRAELAQARDAGALPVLSVGSCEQHGDHLPLDTDSLSAYRVAMLAAACCAVPHVLVLPAPAYGVSPHHQAWPGTVTLRLSTFLALVEDIARSVMRAGFDRLLIVNGHGGNSAPLAALCTELVSAGLRVAAVNYFSPAEAEWSRHTPGGKKTVGHACAYETSLQLVLRPEERHRIAARIAGLPPRLVPAYLEGETNPFAGTGLSYAALFPGGDPGYYGDPAAASVGAGERLLDLTVKGLAGLYASFGATALRVGAGP